MANLLRLVLRAHSRAPGEILAAREDFAELSSREEQGWRRHLEVTISESLSTSEFFVFSVFIVSQWSIGPGSTE